MAKMMIQKFAIGKWDNGTAGPGVFTLCDEQPPTPITNLAEMVVWAKTTYGKTPGSYSLVRMIPGNLEIVIQTSLFAKFGMSEDDDTLPATEPK